MDMSTSSQSAIVVGAEKIIARPIDVVQAQFVDMPHHERAHVHSGLEIGNVRPLGGVGFLFTARRRVFGMLQVDENEVVRHRDGNSTVRSLSGANPGLTIKQTFAAQGPERTLVRVEVKLPLRGLMGLLAPLLRRGIERDLAVALEEDRIDLEERGYSRPASPESTKREGAA